VMVAGKNEALVPRTEPVAAALGIISAQSGELRREMDGVTAAWAVGLMSSTEITKSAVDKMVAVDRTLMVRVPVFLVQVVKDASKPLGTTGVGVKPEVKSAVFVPVRPVMTILELGGQGTEGLSVKDTALGWQASRTDSDTVEVIQVPVLA